MTDVKDAFGRTLSRRRLLGMGALAGMGVAGFSACGGGSSGGPGGGRRRRAGGQGRRRGYLVQLGQPGRGGAVQAISADYEKRYRHQGHVPDRLGDYPASCSPSSSGGSAADAFYVGDDQHGQADESDNVVDLTEFLGTPDGR